MTSTTRIRGASFLVATVVAAAGCATPSGVNPEQIGTNPTDPFERWNRQVYAFNDGLDTAVLKPVATAYRDTVPELARTGVTNFFNNVADAWSAVNLFLQGRVVEGFNDTMRFAVNTTFGLFGLLDIMSEAGLERHGEDLGQTLGVWGLGAGPYIVWPLLGPSSARDTVALPLDRAVTPAMAFSDSSTVAGLSVLQIVNTRASLLGATRMLDDIALDKYTFVRDAYLSRRRSLVYNGDPPPLPEDADPPAKP